MIMTYMTSWCVFEEALHLFHLLLLSPIVFLYTLVRRAMSKAHEHCMAIGVTQLVLTTRGELSDIHFSFSRQ